MKTIKEGKIERVLTLYTKLMNGSVINKAEEAQNFGVNERSIQRDIDDIRNYLDNRSAETGDLQTIIYDRTKKGYQLEQKYKNYLSKSEVLAICKILLSSRAFTKKEMKRLLERLITCCVLKKDKKQIKELIQNEEYHYIEPRHGKTFMDLMWDIGQAIRKCQYIIIEYERTKDKTVVKRKVKPVSILFSEYYFYLTAFIEDENIRKGFDVENDIFPTIYRIDRIQNMMVLKEKFHMPYKNRFEEGEFRKRIQFMYGGKLQKVQFKYSGSDIDAILDRLPTAKVISEEEGIYTVSAEVFGKGIDMWLKSQGDYITTIH